jgi:medium-chain acyl-[acyl-carrier-protein] hydrolase
MSSSGWFVRPQRRSSASLRLFCIPYAGSGSAAYRGWAEAVDPAIDVLYVQAPGRENRLREKPLRSVEALTDLLTEAVIPEIDRPFALYGHSLGGILAFELARAIRQRTGFEPVHLFVSASRAPHLAYDFEPMTQLPDMAFLEELNNRYESIPLALLNDPEIRELLLPCLRADLTMLENYTYRGGAPLACGITSFGGWGDRTVRREALEGWGQHTLKEFRVQMLPGSHLFLQGAKKELIAAVNEALGAFIAVPAQMPRGANAASV